MTFVWSDGQTSAVALIVLIISYLVYTTPRRRSDVDALPGPGSPDLLWGHERYAFEHDTSTVYTKWAAKYGEIYKISGAFFHGPIMIATDRAAAQFVLNRCDDFVKAPQFREVVKRFVGDGMITQEHDGHKRQRRLLGPAFTLEAVIGTMDHVLESAHRLEIDLTNRILSHEGVDVINIAHSMSGYTLDVIGRVAFGHDFQSGQSPEAKCIQKGWDGQLRVANTLPGLVGEFILRAFPFIATLPLPLMQDAVFVKNTINKIASELLQRDDFDEKGLDFLSILIKANKDLNVEDRLTYQELVDNIASFIMAGHETSAAVVAFTFLDLARHEGCQCKLREELRSADRDLTYDSVQKLPYLDAVVKEGLRLHPAARWNERLATKDMTIPLEHPVHTSDGRKLTSVCVTAGQVIHTPFLTMQTSPAVWGEDAADFVPERWIIPGRLPPPSKLPHGWSGILSFSDGPRTCIGYRLALLEMKVILATLVRSFEFADTGAVVKEMRSPSLHACTNGRTGSLPLQVKLAV